MQTVLIVDDNDVNVTLYERVLDSLDDVAAVCYTEPNKALEWCHLEVPSAVVVDYRMPETDGLAFIRRFRTIRGCASVPVMMLTSLDDPALRAHAHAAGANAFLAKPVDKQQFLTLIEKMLDFEARTLH